MTALKRWEPGEIFVEQAFTILLEAAKSNPDFVQTILAEAAQRDPQGIEALLKAAGVEAFGDVPAATQSCGQNLDTAASAPARENYQIGKLTSFGAVYLKRDERLGCDLFAIPMPLRDFTGEIYTCDDTVRKTAENEGLVVKWSIGPENYERTCFASDPANYRKNLLLYLETHMRNHPGDGSAFTRAFISPWVRPVQAMVRHKLAHGEKSDFVLPKRSGSDDGDVIQSIAPTRDHPDDRKVVDGTDGNTAWHRHDVRFGCVLFFAAPAPR